MWGKICLGLISENIEDLRWQRNMSGGDPFVESWNFIAFGVLIFILLFNVFYMQIFSPQIRNAWDNRKSMARNLQDMGLAFDPNRSLPLKKTKVR